MKPLIEQLIERGVPDQGGLGLGLSDAVRLVVRVADDDDSDIEIIDMSVE